MAVFHNQGRWAAEHPVAEKQPVAGPGVVRPLAVRLLSERVQQLGADREHTAGARGQLHLPRHEPRGRGRAYGHADRTRYMTHPSNTCVTPTHTHTRRPTRLRYSFHAFVVRYHRVVARIIFLMLLQYTVPPTVL